MSRKAAVFLSILMLFVTTQVQAVGLGNLNLNSSLNQPLSARIEILDLGNVPPDAITVTLASIADFNRFNVDRIGFLLNIDFEIVTTGSGVFVNLTTQQPVTEPYLSFILDTRWSSGRILSEHTVLLDLPVFDNNAVSEPISQPISQVPDTAPPQGVVQREPTSTVAPVITPVTPAAAQTEPTPVAEEPAPEIVEQIEPEPVADPVVVEEQVEQQQPEPSPTTLVVEEPAPVEPAAPSIPDTLEVQPSDTLWEVALRVRPDTTVSVQQTMLAIQRMNPEAFPNGNINLLRAGEVLQVPDLSDIQTVDQQQAVSEVVRQNQQANIGAQPLSAPATGPSTLATGQQGQLSVLTSEEPAELANAAGEVTDENAVLDARIQSLENQLAIGAEEGDRARLQQEQLVGRLDDLDSQISSAMEIISLQDLQLAQLQESLAVAAAEAAQPAPPPEINVDEELVPEEAAAAAALADQAPAGLVERLLNSLSNSSAIVIGVVSLVVLFLVIFLLRRSRTENPEFATDLGAIPNVDGLVGDNEQLSQDELDEGPVSLSELVADDEADQLPPLETFETEVIAEDENADVEDFEDVLGEDSSMDEQSSLDHFEGQDLDEELVEELDEESDEELVDELDEDIDEVSDEPDYDEIDNLETSDLDDAETATELETELDADEQGEIEAETSEESEAAQEAELQDSKKTTADVPGAVMDLDSIIEMPEETDDLADSDEATTAALNESVTDELLETDSALQADPKAISEENEKIDFDFDELLNESTTDTEATDAIDEDDVLDFDLAEFEDEVEEPGAGITDEVEEFDLDEVDSDVEVMFDLASAEEASGAAEDDRSTEIESARDDDTESVDFSMEEITDSDEITETEPGEEVESFEFDTTDIISEQSTADDNAEEVDLDVVEMDLEAEPEPTSEDAEVSEAPQTESAADQDGADDTEIEIPVDTTDSVDFEIDDVEEDLDVDITASADIEEQDTQIDEPVSTAGETEALAEEPQAQDDLDEVSEEAPETADITDDQDTLIPQEQSENAASDEDQDLNEESDFDDIKLADNAGESKISELDDLQFLAADAEAITEGTEDEFDFLSDDDEAATKLDLAYAYQKMGDVDGAREILEEVMTEGNESQVTEAKSLLGTLEV